VLLKNPEKVYQSSYLAFTSAFWFYMTPASPKPSMHEIATNLYIPNMMDESQGLDSIFGATTMIINGGIECSSGSENDGALDRANYYAHLLDYFDLPTELGTGCSTMQPFSKFSSSAYSQNFAKGGNIDECEVVRYVTQYSYFRNDDYKRCVCDSWAAGDDTCFGNAETEMLQ